MIDDLREAEGALRETAQALEGDDTVPMYLSGDDAIELAEIIRNARRYLALRKQFAPFSMDADGNHSWCWRGNPSRMKGGTLDAAADRLLEGGE